jgi:hypothetical protein
VSLIDVRKDFALCEVGHDFEPEPQAQQLCVKVRAMLFNGIEHCHSLKLKSEPAARRRAQSRSYAITE